MSRCPRWVKMATMAIHITGDAAADQVLDRQPVRAPRRDDARPAVPDGARVPRAAQGARPVRVDRAERDRGGRPRGVRGAVLHPAGDPPLRPLDGRAAPGAGAARRGEVRRRRRAAVDRGRRPARSCSTGCMALPGLRQAEGADLRRAARQAARRTAATGGRRRPGRTPRRATARWRTSWTRRRCRRCATSRRRRRPRRRPRPSDRGWRLAGHWSRSPNGHRWSQVTG